MKENKKITNQENATPEAEAAVATHVSQDLRNAVLIVSLIANLVILTIWIAMQVTYRFDAQIATVLFDR